MRCLRLAAFLATVFATTARAEDPASPSPDETKPAETPWQLVENVPMPTMGGMQFWADELFFHDWRIQRNALTGHCRLLDGKNLRYASGTYEECLSRLDQIKRARNLPPMQGKAVILLHGLADTRLSMTLLGKYLELNGGYTVFNVVYPSTRKSIGEHARSLANVIDNLDGVEEINFVAHSMGNIVIRHYLADGSGAGARRRPDPRIKRFVMLGPPNHGSAIATRLGEGKLYNEVLGKPGQQLGREWVWLEEELAVPACQFAIIAGGLGNQQGFNPLLPGDDDGVVTVESTRLEGASDFAVVPALHAVLPLDATVMKYTLSFLRHGYFVSADERQQEERMNDE
jgi:pimeloyl-ACP methyl ester carboxylesterase